MLQQFTNKTISFSEIKEQILSGRFGKEHVIRLYMKPFIHTETVSCRCYLEESFPTRFYKIPSKRFK